MQVVRNVRSTGPLWAVKTGYIVVSVLFCVLGAVLLVMSERCVPWIGRALGIGMVVCGAIKLGGYFSKDLFRLAFQYDLAFGSLLIAVGIIALCHPGEAMSFLCVMFGIPVLADGLFKIQIAVDARRFGIPQWWLVLALAVLTGVIGLLLVLRPTEGAQALVMLMGVSLLLDGALNLSVALCAVKVVRHHPPAVMETAAFELACAKTGKVSRRTVGCAGTLFAQGGRAFCARTGDGYPIFVKEIHKEDASIGKVEAAGASGGVQSARTADEGAVGLWIAAASGAAMALAGAAIRRRRRHAE